MKMLLKGCRRCGGDLFPDREDREGHAFSCLQCGLSVRLTRVPGPFTLARVPEIASRPRAA